MGNCCSYNVDRSGQLSFADVKIPFETTEQVHHIPDEVEHQDFEKGVVLVSSPNEVVEVFSILSPTRRHIR